jgi:putative ABC transport system permease protein
MVWLSYLKKKCNSDVRSFVPAYMGTFGADVRYAMRMLKSNPGFTAIAVAALALGIGANTAIFTVVNSVLLQPLPYPQPDRIMQVGRQFRDGASTSNSIPKFMVWRHNDVFEALTLFGQSGTGVNIAAGDRPEQARALRASQDYFRVFGVSPTMGRGFTQEEDLPNGPSAVVLSYGVWQSRFGGDPRILGRAVPVDGKPTVVVGVMPKGFQPDPPSDVFLPLQADPNSTNQGHYLRVAGRLKPGVTVKQAVAAMKIVGERFRAANPKWMDKNESVGVVSLREATVGQVKTALFVLLGAVAFVLLIACANVANLLLARAAVRQKELAVRAAIGASRARVIRQLLTESAILAVIGGALGFALGSWGVRLLLMLAPGNIPRLTDADGIHTVIPALDWRVAAFTMAVALGTAIVFGLLPALNTSKPDLASTLKDAGGRSGVSRAQNRARSVLVVAEVALALVLLIGASLLIRTFVGLRSVKPGIDVHNVLTLETSLGAAYAQTAKVDNLVTQVVRRVEALPGVESAASAIALPVTTGIDLPFTIAGKPPKEGQYNGDQQWRSVSPRYFQTFRIPLRRGRVFRETDVSNSTRAVIINEAMAKKYWPNEDPIGQVITIGKGLGPDFDDPPRQIIGIVGNVRETGLGDGETGVMYVPQSQVSDGISKLATSVLPLAWAIRTAGDPTSLRNSIEREFHAVDNLVAVTHERTMEQVIAEGTARQNFNMLLLTVFAGVALLLAAIGVYGVMAYSVERRTQEMGIRMALGAARGDLFKLVLAHGMKLTGAGVVAGLAIAYGTTRLLATLLFEVKAADPLTFAAVAGVLSLVALFATYIPARRAAAIEPSDALRYQ